MKIKMLSLFSGIGAFEKALHNIGIEVDLVNFCEIDKCAAKSYCAVHDVSPELNLVDVTKVDTDKLPKDIDLITYGFPCQDISNAGKMRGFTDESGNATRSGLFFDALNIINECQPKIAIAENVKNLTSKKFENEFKEVLTDLDAVGYNNYWQVLNAKDYGIPQNRERVFIISIRKDIDDHTFMFPVKQELVLRLKDMLESNVDEKYYLSNNNLKWLNDHNENHIKKGTGFLFKPKNPENDIASTFGEADIKGYGEIKRVFDPSGIAPTLDTMQGGNRQPKIIDDTYKSRDSRVYSEYSPSLRSNRTGFKVVEDAKIEIVGNYSPSGHDASRIVSEDGLAPTVKENHGTVTAVAQRGRYNENGETEQRIEFGDDKANAITSAQKDSMFAIPVNPMPDGSCRTIKEQYSQTSIANTARTGSMGATMKAEKLDDSVPTNEKEQIYKVEDKEVTFKGKNGNQVTYPMNLDNGTYRIRKLTPKECWRLMGFYDEDFLKAEQVNSNSQLYKQAGNSIVVNVLEEIFKCLYNEQLCKEEI